MPPTQAGPPTIIHATGTTSPIRTCSERVFHCVGSTNINSGTSSNSPTSTTGSASTHWYRW